jgi:hypothetical protein
MGWLDLLVVGWILLLLLLGSAAAVSIWLNLRAWRGRPPS